MNAVQFPGNHQPINPRKEGIMATAYRARFVPLALLLMGLLATALAYTAAYAHGASAVALAGPGSNEVMLANVKTGKCLTIAGGVTTANNAEAVQFDCDADPSRRWTLSDATGAGMYQIRNVRTGKCLTIAGGVSTANNVVALQFDCDTDPSRRWTLADVTGSAIYQIRNVQTGKCLTIAGGVSTQNNVQALQFECDADPSRRWTLRLKV